ncbi:MAG: tetratricopeptide repeat protein [Sphingobium sp.]
MSAGLETIFLKAKRAEHRGDEAEARRLLEEVLLKYPNNRKARIGLDRLDQVGDGPGKAELDAIDALIRLRDRQDHMGVLARGSELVERFPRSARLWVLIANAYVKLKEYAQAERIYRVAIQVDAAHVEGHTGLAKALMRQGRLDGAQAACRAALDIDPGLLAAHAELGLIQYEAKDYMQAVDSLLRAITIKPDDFESIFALGHALLAMGNIADAIDVYHQATLVNPDSPKAFVRYGDVLRMVGRMQDYHAAMSRALELHPGNAYVKANLLSAEAAICDWHRRDQFSAISLDPRGKEVIQPFIALPFEDDPARQRIRSEAMAASLDTYLPKGHRFPAKKPGEKIRIGYFSADFHNHATLYLMAGLLREHDRERFEIRAYSFGALTDTMRDEVMPYLDAFTDIQGLTNAQAAEGVREDRLDIAVDLKGYTADGRPELFAERLAPVQIAYLGYPGTVGGDFMDYMIADDIVLPEGDETYYSERIIRLPDSYQPNDNQRPIGTCPDDRTALGLPAEGFIFCSFNNNYKISPAEFDIWMRLLHQVEGSVLWLFQGNEWAAANLRKEAEKRGIDPARLVFAERRGQSDHLARHRHADLFLDTFAVNAHTTASDALWTGVPVLTLAGRQFAARVAASLLSAIGLPDLIATSEGEYEEKALELARSPEKLAELKARLDANRLTAPLFDTARYTRQIEAAYEAAHQRRLDGLAPDHIRIG